MYEKVFEQAESFFKPVTEILALNAEAFDTLRTKNADLVSEMFDDGMACAKGLAKPDIDIDTIVNTQQQFLDGLRDKLTHGVQNNYEVISDMQGRVGALLQDAWHEQATVQSDKADAVGTVTAGVASVDEPKPAKVRKKPAAKRAAKAQAKVKKVEASETPTAES